MCCDLHLQKRGNTTCPVYTVHLWMCQCDVNFFSLYREACRLHGGFEKRVFLCLCRIPLPHHPPTQPTLPPPHTPTLQPSHFPFFSLFFPLSFPFSLCRKCLLSTFVMITGDHHWVSFDVIYFFLRTENIKLTEKVLKSSGLNIFEVMIIYVKVFVYW